MLSSITGDILGATELRGPVNYKYNDLKSATKNFSEENKLGEGGFGDVYKVKLKKPKASLPSLYDSFFHCRSLQSNFHIQFTLAFIIILLCGGLILISLSFQH